MYNERERERAREIEPKLKGKSRERMKESMRVMLCRGYGEKAHSDQCL